MNFWTWPNIAAKTNSPIATEAQAPFIKIWKFARLSIVIEEDFVRFGFSDQGCENLLEFS